MRTALRLAAWLALALPGCVVFNDEAGVLVSAADVHAIEVGRTTRQELLTRFGPPTGLYSTDPREILAGFGALPEEPATPGRIDDEAFTWQHLRTRAQVAMVPIFLMRIRARVSSTTLTVFFDERGVVRGLAWREDEP